MLASLLPSTVSVAEAFADDEGARLFPEEEPAVARAVDKRRREYATVRACARAALARIGIDPVAIPKGEKGAPTWPEGVVGSLTHCDGYRAGAVALRRDVLTVGVDAEPHAPLPPGVQRMIALPAEDDMLGRLASGADEVCWDRLLFCAKEAVYKAWFPLARRWLDFSQARIDIDPAGTFAAELLVPGPELSDGPLTGFTGRWSAERGLLLAAIALPSPPGTAAA